MKLTKRNAVLLAVLIVALGVVALPRGGAAGGNEDVVQMPPGENGDPDTGGQSRFSGLIWSSWLSTSGRSLSSLRIFLVGQVVPSRGRPGVLSRQFATARR